MKLQLIIRDLKQVFRHPHNKANPFSAIARYTKYLFLKLKRKDTVIEVWKDKKAYYFADSVQSTWLLFNYIIDWEEFNLIQKKVKGDSVFIDIGANIGYYSIWASKFVKEGRIYSLEPNERNYARLKKNIDVNNLGSVITPLPFAAANFTGHINMTNNLDTLNHLTSDTSPKPNTVSVPCITIDDLLEKEGIKFISYLKVDVEGFELDVLRGAKRALSERRISIIQLEINNAVKNSGNNVDDLLQNLTCNGYVLCKYDCEQELLVPIKYTPERENYFAVACPNQLC